MADREIVEQLLYQYIQENADMVKDFVLNQVHADLGTHTNITMQDIANSLKKLFGKQEVPKGIVFKEI